MMAKKQFRELLQKYVAWHWQKSQENSFGPLKLAITQTPVLRYFDVDDEVKLSVDASLYGLGACLMQNNQPIGFASRSLNSAERN